MIHIALLLAAAAPGHLRPGTPLLGVAELEQRHRPLTGHIVQVRGRLAECRPSSCGLLDDERVAAPIAWLSFERARPFDAAAQAMVGHRVIVEGVVLGNCWPDRRNSPPCPDRAPQFRPTRIVRVLSNQGSGS